MQVIGECSSSIFILILKGYGTPAAVVSTWLSPPYSTTFEPTGLLQLNVHEQPFLNRGERNTDHYSKKNKAAVCDYSGGRGERS